jgi:CMP-2-keto-3-deoxyoctulosonic acid synthetase
MVEILRIRRLEIEQLEGITIMEIGERVTMPGVCKVSPAAIDWRAQQHMVKQWGEALTEKEEELEAMRASLNMP